MTEVGWDYLAEHEGGALRVDPHGGAVARAIADSCRHCRGAREDALLGEPDLHYPINDPVIALAGRLGLDDGEAI